MDYVPSQQGFFVPPPAYRKAPPPIRERVQGFVRGFSGFAGDSDPVAPPVEVIDTNHVPAARSGQMLGPPAVGSGWNILGMTALRTALLLPGLWMANSFSAKDTKLSGGQLVAYSIAGSVTITGGLLLWYKLNELRAAQPQQ